MKKIWKKKYETIYLTLKSVECVIDKLQLLEYHAESGKVVFGAISQLTVVS